MATIGSNSHCSDEKLTHIQIVSVADGEVTFLDENLKSFLKEIDLTNFSRDVSIAFVAVIGPKNSGTTILTNFLLEFLTANDDGGWLTHVEKRNNQGKSLKGFPIENDDSLYNQSIGGDASDGIYLWPELFFVNTFREETKKAVCVLHVCCSENENNVNIFEQLLALMCSRILEIRWMSQNIRLFDHIHVLTESEQKQAVLQPCKSFMYLVRTEKNSNSEMGSPAIEHIQKLFQEDIERQTLYQNILNKFDYITLSCIKKDDFPLQNIGAIFGKKSLLNKISNIIDDLMDESEIIPKTISDNTFVTIQSVVGFLESVVNNYKLQKSTEGYTELMRDLVTQDSEESGAERFQQELKIDLKDNIVDEEFFPTKIAAAPVSPDENSANCLQSTHKALRTVPDNMEICSIAPKIKPRRSKGLKTTIPPIPPRTDKQVVNRIINPGCDKSPEYNQIPELMEVDDEHQSTPLLVTSEKNNIRMTATTDEVALENRMSLELQKSTNSKASSACSKVEQKLPFVQQSSVKEVEISDNVAIGSREENMDSDNPQEFLNEEFKHFIRDWVDTHSKLNTLGEVEYFFRNISRQILGIEIEVSNKPTEEILEIIGEAVLKFIAAVNRMLGKLGFLLSYDFSHRMQTYKDKTIEHLVPGFAIDMVCIVVQNITLTLAKYNSSLLKDAKMFVISTYHEEMQKYLSFGPMNDAHLDLLHDILTDHLILRFVENISLQKNYAVNLTEWTKKLNKYLDKALYEIKLERLNFALKKVMMSVKTQYNNLITDALAAHPDGLEPNKLDQIHENIKSKIMNVLFSEITSKVRENEPLEEHKLCVLNYIENYWPAVVDANKALQLKSKERHSRTLTKDHKDDTNISCSKRRNTQRVNCILPGTNVQKDDQNSKLQAGEQFEKTKSMKTIIFHLQCPNISMSMEIDGKTKILQNINGEPKTAACVMLTSDQQFIYGTEAIVNFQRKVSCNWFWCLEDFFQDAQKPPKDLATKQGVCKLTNVFILAFLLRTLKNTIENQYNTCLASTVAVVPMRLSHSQRNQIRVAGEIAGFVETRLVSEPYATALSFSQDPDFGESHIMVLCESLGYTEVLLYICSSANKTCMLLGTDGNCMEQVKSGSSIQIKFKILSSKPSINYTKAKQICKNALKIPEQKGRKDRKKLVPTAFLFIVGDEGKWGKDLEKLQKEIIHKNTENVGWKALMVGAVEFSKSQEEDEVFAKCQTVSHCTSSPCKLSCDDVSFSKKLLDSITKTKKVEAKPSIEILKEVALTKIQTMMVNISEGKYYIRSSVVRELVISKVEQAKIEILKENLKFEDIQEQMIILENICSKYTFN